MTESMESPLTRIVAETANMVRSRMANDATGHDWWHVERVRRTALYIAQREGGNAVICELAALLHDLGDWKFQAGDETAGPRMSREWLESLAVPAPIIDHVCTIIEGISFKGAGVSTDMPTLEGQCVQDADRLDAIGAVGIARAFAFGGAFGRAMYDPEIPPQLHVDFDAYKSKSGPTLNHFYEKLLLLKDRMQTATGRALACERHAFMERYLQQFQREWNGPATL